MIVEWGEPFGNRTILTLVAVLAAILILSTPYNPQPAADCIGAALAYNYHHPDAPLVAYCYDPTVTDTLIIINETNGIYECSTMDVFARC